MYRQFYHQQSQEFPQGLPSIRFARKRLHFPPAQIGIYDPRKTPNIVFHELVRNKTDVSYCYEYIINFLKQAVYQYTSLAWFAIDLSLAEVAPSVGINFI